MVMQMRSLLKHIMDDRGLTVQQVAQEIDYNPGLIEELYNDEMEMYPRELLERVCVYLGVPLSDLFGMEGE